MAFQSRNPAVTEARDQGHIDGKQTMTSEMSSNTGMETPKRDSTRCSSSNISMASPDNGAVSNSFLDQDKCYIFSPKTVLSNSFEKRPQIQMIHCGHSIFIMIRRHATAAQSRAWPKAS